MRIMAHIPTQTYGFIEVEGTLEDKSKIEQLYNEYAEKSLSFGGGVFEELVSFTGETVLYDSINHIYKDTDGNVLLGGSTYAKQFEKPFDKETVLVACEKAWGVDAPTIENIWELNVEVSTSFGSALHLALDLAHRHGDAGEVIQDKKKNQEENYALPKNPVIRKAVVAFLEEYGRDALPEVLVSDAKRSRAGQIDRLVILDKEKKTCRVQDYKSSVIDKKKLEVYAHQLSFYAKILQDAGWTVEGLDVFAWDGDKWTKHELELKEVKNG